MRRAKRIAVAGLAFAATLAVARIAHSGFARIDGESGRAGEAGSETAADASAQAAALDARTGGTPATNRNVGSGAARMASDEGAGAEDAARSVPPVARAPAPTSENAARNAAYQALLSARTPDEAREAAKDLRLDGFTALAPTASPLGADALASLAGTYTGTIQFDGGATPAWSVRLDLLSNGGDDRFSGKYELVVQGGDGQLVARTQGVNDAGAFRSLASDPNAILVEVMRNRGYLQLYSVESQSLLAGNFYFRPASAGGSAPDYQEAGTVILRR